MGVRDGGNMAITLTRNTPAVKSKGICIDEVNQLINNNIHKQACPVLGLCFNGVNMCVDNKTHKQNCLLEVYSLMKQNKMPKTLSNDKGNTRSWDKDYKLLWT